MSFIFLLLTPFVTLAVPFIGRPWACWAVAALFLFLLSFKARKDRETLNRDTLSSLKNSKILVLTIVYWFLFGVLESTIDSARENIRIDLVISWPPLVILSAIALYRVFRNKTLKLAKTD